MSTRETSGARAGAQRAARATPIRINLLPHRRVARERRKREFSTLVGLVGLAGAAAVFAGGMEISRQIDAQQDRNRFVQTETERLDRQIAEIRTLRDDIVALRARQEAVEALQRERTLPVRLFDELIRMVPEGLYLRSLKQDEQRVVLVGHAHSNERVAELLRNLSDRSPWLERPELSEIKEVEIKAGPGQKEARRVYEFTLNALIKRPGQPGDAPRKGVSPTTATEPLKLGAAGQ